MWVTGVQTCALPILTSPVSWSGTLFIRIVQENLRYWFGEYDGEIVISASTVLGIYCGASTDMCCNLLEHDLSWVPNLKVRNLLGLSFFFLMFCPDILSSLPGQVLTHSRSSCPADSLQKLFLNLDKNLLILLYSTIADLLQRLYSLDVLLTEFWISLQDFQFDCSVFTWNLLIN